MTTSRSLTSTEGLPHTLPQPPMGLPASGSHAHLCLPSFSERAVTPDRWSLSLCTSDGTTTSPSTTAGEPSISVGSLGSFESPSWWFHTTLPSAVRSTHTVLPLAITITSVP